MMKLKKVCFAALPILCLSACDQNGASQKTLESVTVQNGEVYYYINGLEKPFHVMFLSDTHFTVEDERGREFYDYAKRMGGDAAKPENYGKGNRRDLLLTASLDRAKAAGAELVILGGDIINYPSLASVERVKTIMDSCGINWVYTPGNHDWHYEGEPGDSRSQHDKWTKTNLVPLYQGKNPLYDSQIINGINFVTIDNSDFEISQQQLDFFKAQIAKGLPIILGVHIPFYLQGHNIDYGCGSPYWNDKSDIYYEIERRAPWPKEGLSKITFEFRDLAIGSPTVIGIYAGHVHEEAVDYVNNRIQYVAGANYDGKDILIHFIPAE